MKRITMDDLECVVRRINITTKSPLDAWHKNKDGKLIANIGNYHLDGAYGGWKLVRHISEGGGITEAIHTGFVSKRELYTAMHAYLNGLDDVAGSPGDGLCRGCD